MSLLNILPFASTLVMLIFTVSVFQRYFVRHNLAFLYWGIGLLMFGLGSFAEAYLALAWSPAMFYVWYLFGAVLTAAWIGHGTLHLLVKKSWVHYVTAVLIVLSIAATALLLSTPINGDAYRLGPAISELYPEIMPRGALVRSSTPIFNTYGVITIVGGALYSGYLFWRKRVLPNRMFGNILIAAGAIVIALAGLLTRYGLGKMLYIGEIIAAVLMYAGFVMAAAPAAQTSSPESTPPSIAPAGR
jgi:drug/metabolite transporter (DMT)-like permease